MQKLLLILITLTISHVALGKASIDRDVLLELNRNTLSPVQPSSISVIVFLKSQSDVPLVLHDLSSIPGIKIQPLHFMPAVVVILPKKLTVLNQIANHYAAAQVSSNKPGSKELEVSAQSLLLTPSDVYPTANNWWLAGYTGKHGIVGLIDSGIAVEHPGLADKNIIVRQDADSHYSKYLNGVRSGHGTGAACIYAGSGNGIFARDKGIAYGASTILSGMAGADESDSPEEELMLTTATLDWMLTRAKAKPTIINYSFGNGGVSCPACTDWSGLAKIVDYVVNHDKILWVKSAGNKGYTTNKKQSTMSTPADNYNALTVANMNPTVKINGVIMQTPNRNQHAIKFTSSRGPTLMGRRKPDISAPGNDTRTCAPDPFTYPFKYTAAMDYHDGYRLMGGTSSAAPHVGGAVLLLQDAGIKNPIAEKALLLNSTDAWTDSGKPGPDDPSHVYTGGHYAVEGSEWNPTYGWGYMNMQKAFDQRDNMIEDQLTTTDPVKNYEAFLPVGGKVTLVHERRVGYTADNSEWKLSHLSLEIYDADTEELIAKDSSPIDTVHQVANCNRESGNNYCSAKTKAVRVIIRVKLLNQTVDGSQDEPFAIVFG